MINPENRVHGRTPFHGGLVRLQLVDRRDEFFELVLEDCALELQRATSVCEIWVLVDAAFESRGGNTR